MAQKELRCKKCGKAIKKREDLVVTTRMVTRFFTLHKDCFQAALDEGEQVGRATNTTISNAAWLIVTVVGMVYYITTREPVILYVLTFSILYRLYIWYKFERILD